MFALTMAMVTPSLMPAFSKTVTVQAAELKINKKKVTLSVGKTCKLSVTGVSKNIKWSSSNSKVATVSNKGKVTAKNTGTATITAKADAKEYTCQVTVKEAAASTKSQTTVYGKVTKISGKNVTIALGTLKEPSGQPGGQANGQTGTTPAAPPSGTPDDNTSGTASGPGSSSSNNNQSTNQSGSQPGGQLQGQPGGAPDMLTLTGKSITITISDTSILFKQTMQALNGQASGSQSNNSSAKATTANTSSSTASLSDIAVGSILKVTYKASITNLVSVEIVGGGQPGGSQQGGGQPGGTNSGSSSVSSGTGAYNLKDGEELTSGTYTSTKADENAIRAENSVKASLTDATVTKASGAASSNDASSFYGLNSAILALGSSTLNITGGSVSADADGANGVFAYGGATINIKNTKIDVTGGNAGGIEVAGGGIMNATNLTVNSKVKAAIRSDRGGGTMTVNGGTYTTSGSSGAPAIYSTANINVSDATLTANNSEAVVVEGLNSVTLNNCNATGNMSGTYGDSSGENIHNVMLYQSMSGDAEVGNSSFTMTDGSLTSKNGDMFYVTNTDCAINLSNVALTLADNTKLLIVAGNDGSRGWGKAGSNGGNCTFTASKQTLAGDITVDKISKLAMTIKDSSSFTGSINSDGTTASTCSVTLDSSSTWTLTADSYVTEFSGDMSSVNLNGHTLYVNGVAKTN